MGPSPPAWELGARSETGYVRTANEDRMSWVRTAYGDVYIVSDGMGGYLGGAMAAEITVNTLQAHLARIPADSPHFGDGLRQAFQAANAEVFKRRNPADPNTRDMGATGVAIVTAGARFMVAHVGDSRAYLWRPGTGLKRLTQDHTRVQSMLNAGLLTPDEAAAHPDASVLDRAMGNQATVQVDVADWSSVQPGDMLLMCSDGLCGYVQDDEIAAVVAAGGSPQAITDRLIELALGKGGEDNVTVQLVGYALRANRRTTRSLPRTMGPLPAAALASGLTAVLIGGAGYGWYRMHPEPVATQVAAASAAGSAKASAPRASTAGAAASAAPAASVPAQAASAASAPAAQASSPTGAASAASKGPVTGAQHGASGAKEKPAGKKNESGKKPIAKPKGSDAGVTAVEQGTKSPETPPLPASQAASSPEGTSPAPAPAGV